MLNGHIIVFQQVDFDIIVSFVVINCFSLFCSEAVCVFSLSLSLSLSLSGGGGGGMSLALPTY